MSRWNTFNVALLQSFGVLEPVKLSAYCAHSDPEAPGVENDFEAGFSCGG
jgi:hypothetical protein